MLLYLLNFWLPIFGLFFAAGATIGDVGVGGGDGGDSSNSGGDTGEAGGDADAIGDDGSDGGSEGGDSDSSDDDEAGTGDDGADSDADPNATVDLGDGRQVPAKFKKLFDLAKTAGLEKEAKQLYFAQQRLSKAIPGGVNGAIQLAKSVEELGGVEGIQGLQSDLETYTADADLFASNPGKWAETGFESNPDSALKAFVHSLDLVAEKHPETYDHLMAKVIMNDMGELPVREIHAILSGLKDNPEAQRAAKALADYYNSRLATSKKAPEKKVDDASKALSDRETTVHKQEMDLRYKQVNNEVFPQLKSCVTKTLLADAKAAGLDLNKLSVEYPAEWRNMLNEIHQGTMQAAIKDQRFIDKYYALIEKGDLKRASKTLNDKHEQIVPDIARKVMGTYGVFRSKKAAPGGKDKNKPGNAKPGDQNQPQSKDWLKVSKRPQNSAINWSKTSGAMQLDGKYILNDGKKVVVQY